MESTKGEAFQTRIVAGVAGEDIQPGDFLTLSSELVELPSYLWSCESTSITNDEPVRIRYIPSEAGEPLKVIAICLPFVYAKQAKGATRILDIRQHQLVKLDAWVGRKVWKRLKAAKSTSKLAGVR
jgi:hypothetical protein